MIEVDSVRVVFGDVPVLDGVSLSVEAGELVGLVGPNGAGKTTLLRAITAARSPDAGRVRIDGRLVKSLSSRATSRLVSVVPQDTQLSFSFPVREVVEMGLTPYRSRFAAPTPADRARVDSAMERTQVSRFADRSIDAISGGERQRVVLARTIAQDTPAILLDEPTASLDVAYRIEILELVSELVGEGKAALAAIHDLELAARYCDRLAVLSRGRIVEVGPPEAVLTRRLLSEAFDANAAVGTNPVTGSPTVTALPRDGSVDLPDRVHVLGRGSAAAGVLARLAGLGVAVTAGPLLAGGPAATVAAREGIEATTAEPYTPLAADLLEQVADSIEAADAVVVCDLEAGAGNRAILSALEGESTVVCETTPLAERAHDDEAAAAYRRLKSKGITCEPSSVPSALATLAGSKEEIDGLPGE